MYETGNVRVWASDLDPNTLLQAGRTSRLPCLAGPVALMADAHVGIGATVGSVVATAGAIIPSAVGVDIGCGMIAMETSLHAEHLPDTLTFLHARIAKVVPSGLGKAHDGVSRVVDRWMEAHKDRGPLVTEHAVLAARQLGTLGSGNHFVEICLDERTVVWIVLHSGSRGIGNKLGTDHIKKARNLAKQLQTMLEDPDLASFVEGTPEFQAYIRDMLWAQDYARVNRDIMVTRVYRELVDYVGFGHEVSCITSHHNYAVQEVHDDRKMWVTRKGAVRAGAGDWGIIPGSMATGTFIVRGKGNPLSYTSCSHGAGRRMSRGEARRTLTATSLVAAMAGKAWNTTDAESLVDEHPDAYKDVSQVMRDQEDLVEIVHTLHQVLNLKGT